MSQNNNQNDNGNQFKPIHVRQVEPWTEERIQRMEVRYPALKALNDFSTDKTRGYIMPRETAIQLCGGEKEFKRVAMRWRMSILFRRGITVDWSAKDKGYLFVTVEHHQTVRNQRRLAAIERTHRMESLRLGLIPDDDFESDHQRQLRILELEQHARQANVIASNREHVRLALQRPETLPRLPGS